MGADKELADELVLDATLLLSKLAVVSVTIVVEVAEALVMVAVTVLVLSMMSALAIDDFVD